MRRSRPSIRIDRPGLGLDLAEVGNQVLAPGELDQLAALVVARLLKDVDRGLGGCGRGLGHIR